MCPMKSIFIQSSTRKIIIIIEVVVIAMHLVRKVPLQPINEWDKSDAEVFELWKEGWIICI